MRIATTAIVLSIAGAVQAQSIYLIGNSLTNDTSPGYLTGSVQYHIDCSKNLQYIHDHPNDPTCVASTTPWSAALPVTAYDFLSVQPYLGTTLTQDVTVIGEWLALQPSAVVIVHTGWGPSATFETLYHGGWAGGGATMVHSPAYFDALMSALEAAHPTREFRSTDLLNIMDGIYHDIGAGIGPYGSLADLYRDPIHLNYNDGYFLAHNAMRRALGQPFRLDRFSVPADRQTYLLAAIERCPADRNRDRVADVFDLLTYLDQWFAGSSLANSDENEAIDVFDLLAFLDAWFAGC